MIETLPSFLAAGTRYLAAGALLLGGLAIWNRARDRLRPALRRRELGWAAVTAVLLPVLGNGGVVLSLERIPTGVAALVIATEPVLIALMIAAIDRRPPTRGVLFGVAAGVAGIFVLVAPWNGVEAVDPVGLALCAAAAVGWSAGSVLTARVEWGVPAPVVGGWQMLMGGVMLLALGVVGGELGAAVAGTASAASVLALGYLIVFGSILAYSAFTWLLSHASTSLVSTFAFVNPLVAVGLGAVVLGESVGPQTAVAAGLIVLAVVAIIASEARGADSRRPAKSGSRLSRDAAIPRPDGHATEWVNGHEA